ncbi:ligase-associated DNA damage response DEXH box helicase [Hyphomicrobium sp. CS1BSMeth3]|uniref:ligase-associated DNA damage response DEXH box helicase n=1 Tax=Hyphomicrobium sp. CS1BSMeth3 TaxID=1892844 RepID=UPI000931354C|nr:ligase-associated DNA damage response DEXH box helicase [Hyphomicrobium sp. CS1BSMeth3]
MRARSKSSPLSTARPRTKAAPAVVLPEPFAGWFAQKGWQPRAHQLALLAQAEARRSTLLIAPTGAGKTLAGFLPSLVALHANRDQPAKTSGLRTLYISPLKALAVDIARNLLTPIEDMGLDIRVETRTGDTPASKRQRQRLRPPEILLTTPEQLALLLASPDAAYIFGDLDTLILDELHALAPSKRGDLLALDVARLRALAPSLMSIGLSATVAQPSELRAWLTPQRTPDTTIRLADVVTVDGGAKPQIMILETEGGMPIASHTARYAVPDVLAAIARHRLALIFVNTRMQAELMFQELWKANTESLPIALHHGSLDVGQRRKVEAAMSRGALRAVVATSTLDLGIDWGDVDLVIHLGAPKGASRLIQRIGRANHRLDEPSNAILVPANRFEVLECRAALEAALAGEQDAVIHRKGTMDVLAQHVLGMACAGPFHVDVLYEEVRAALPYTGLSRTDFDRVVDFVATGGYALRQYERFARLKPDAEGRWRLTHPSFAQQYRMNVGTIVEKPLLKVRMISARRRRPGSAQGLMGGRMLGEIDDEFAAELSPDDTFMFAGQILRMEGLTDEELLVSRSNAKDPKVPSYPGGRFPLSTHLAARVRQMLADPAHWQSLPPSVAHWLEIQQRVSMIPAADEVLVETFPRNQRHYLAIYPFEGRIAHQTLGMLLTRRLHRAGALPLGFVANDYALSVWAARDIGRMLADGELDLADLFDEDMLGDDLEAWLAETSLMRRTFRTCAVIAGLVERRAPRHKKNSRQLSISTNLIYDVLRRHDPHHILLEAAYQDAATGLLDIQRLAGFLARIKGRIRHSALDRVSPLAVPLIVELGRESVHGASAEELLREAAEELIAEAAEPGSLEAR